MHEILLAARGEIGSESRIRDADLLLDSIKAQRVEPSEAEVCKISEIALQDIYGLLTEWDEETSGGALSSEYNLRWLYALLCLTEKPLLAEQAADMNSLLGRLRNQ